MDCSEFNRLLDGYIDGELNEAQRRELMLHAEKCRECAEKLAASEQLRDVLSHLNDDISVPLSAQAAWRKAIKEEARRKRMKRIYSACGAAAAVCVLTLGVTAMLRPGSDVLNQNTPRVETDGVTVAAQTPGQAEAALMSTRVRALEYIDRRISAEDPEKAYEYLLDVIAEYGGTVERESEGDEKTVFVQIPGENAVDFLSAVESLGEPDDAEAIALDESAPAIDFCVTVSGM